MTVASLDWRDEANLTWYYSTGQTLFERSAIGGMLERAEQFSVPTLSVSVPVRNDAGHVIGYTSGIDAQPTAELRSMIVNAPEDTALTLYGVVSRRLMLLEARSAIACAVLEALYGDLGARWMSTRLGRLAALYHLTEAGRRLLEADERDRKVKGQPPVTLGAHLRMANEIEPPRDSKNVSRERAERRRVGLMRCERQAHGLRAEAIARWNAVKAEQRERAA